MAEEKTYVFGESANNGILGLLGPMLSALTRFYADCIGSGTPIMWEDMGSTEHLFGGLRLARNCILCSRYLLYRWNSRRIRTNRM